MIRTNHPGVHAASAEQVGRSTDAVGCAFRGDGNEVGGADALLAFLLALLTSVFGEDMDDAPMLPINDSSDFTLEICQDLDTTGDGTIDGLALVAGVPAHIVGDDMVNGDVQAAGTALLADAWNSARANAAGAAQESSHRHPCRVSTP